MCIRDSKEVIEAVTRIVEEVAEEHGANTAVALAKACLLYTSRCV